MPEPQPEPQRVKGFDWVRAHWDELPKDLWVAVTGSGPVATAENCQQLLERLRDRIDEAEPAVIVLRHDGKPFFPISSQNES